jgi:hypothetical protein
MGGRKYNILIIHVMNKHTMRATLWDQLYSFRRYSNHNCYYLNLSIRSVPWYLKKIKIDLIVFGTIFLANRVVADWFEPLLEKARPLKSINAVKTAFPQDEHSHTEVLSSFIKEFGIDNVFSVAPESEWPQIYESIDFDRVKFFNVLTGYLDNATVSRIDKLAAAEQVRDIDLGYRTWRAAPNLGRHGFLRQQIADLFQEKAPMMGLKTDISTRREDTIWGDEWYEFLLNCKYTMSVEGGASILDRDGAIGRETSEYLKIHPEASFEEVEQACFPGLDGALNYVALSPRHLEACATRTCQILVEGKYNGVLKAGRHYIELKSNFGNIDQVLEAIKQDHLREEITERAYQEIVASERYTYKSYVDFVLEKSLPGFESEKARAPSSGWNTLVYYWMRVSDFVSWVQIRLSLHSFVAQFKEKLYKGLLSFFSEETVVSLIGRVRQRKGK